MYIAYRVHEEIRSGSTVSVPLSYIRVVEHAIDYVVRRLWLYNQVVHNGVGDHNRRRHDRASTDG